MASISASENVKDFLSKLCNDEKYKKWIIVCGLIGIALIFLSGFFKGGQKTKDVDTDKIFEKGESSKTKQGNTGLGLWNIRQILNKNNNLNLFTSKNNQFFRQQFEIYY